jgi:hypothetical protein
MPVATTPEQRGCHGHRVSWLLPAQRDISWFACNQTSPASHSCCTCRPTQRGRQAGGPPSKPQLVPAHTLRR